MRQSKFHKNIPNNMKIQMGGDTVGDVIKEAMQKETIPKGICKCRLIFAKAGQTDIWVWLTWGGYGKIMGIGEVHNNKLSFEVIHDGETNIALPTNHQHEPFSIRGILAPAVVDIALWQKLFGVDAERPILDVHLNGSTLRKLIDIEEGHHDVN